MLQLKLNKIVKILLNVKWIVYIIKQNFKNLKILIYTAIFSLFFILAKIIYINNSFLVRVIYLNDHFFITVSKHLIFMIHTFIFEASLIIYI